MFPSTSLCSRLGVVAAVAAAVAACESPGALDAWPGRLVVRSPGLQTGLQGYAVNEPPTVELLDVDGAPIARARISFTVTGGGGSALSGVATTGADGRASTAWTIAAGANDLTASIPAPFRVAPVRFSATGAPPAYDANLSYVTAIPAGRRAVFDSAAARWERLLWGDVVDITVDIPADICFAGQPRIAGTIDDVLIFVSLDSIDGPSGVLGRAGPCFVRSTGFLPLVGVMQFDTADVAALEQVGLFDEVILHEMAHVIGFGGFVWTQLNLVAGRGGSDPYFVGVKGRAAFDHSGGTGYSGQKIPVENTGGAGTRDSHWRESVFDRELMTGFLDGGVANPLSVVSVAAMEDEGYRVNYAAADGFTVSFAPPGGAPGRAGAHVVLGDDLWRLPIHVLDARGRVMAVYRQEGP